MNIMLGNLTVSQIESRLGIQFPEDIRQFMRESHQPEASNIKAGKWHCFDMPFNIVCGDMDVALKIFNSVKDRAGECKQALSFSITQ